MPEVLSAQLPVGVAERVRALAADNDRTVSYTVRRLLESALDANGAPPQDAAAKNGEHTPDAYAD